MKQWIINQSVNHPKRSIILSIIITLLMGSGLRFFVIEDDFMKLLPQDVQSMITWNEVRDEFGSTDLMFVAFGHPGQNALNAKTLAALWDVTQAMEEVEDVAEIMTLTNFNRMDSDDGFLEVSELQPRRDLSEEEVESIRTYLQDNDKIRTRVLSKQGDYLNIMVRPIVHGRNDVIVTGLEKAAGEHLDGYDIHWGGQAYLTGALPLMIRNDVASLMRVGVLGMVIILLLSFRNFPAVGIVLATILLSLVFMLGFHGWMYYLTGSDAYLFSILNTSMPIILLTIANSYGVHIITKFFRKMRLSKDVTESVQGSLESLTLPVFLAALTTIAAFLCMIFAPLESLLGYGISVSMGILWAFVLTTIFLPSVLILKKWNLDSTAIAKPSAFERFVVAFGDHVIARPKTVLVVVGAIVLVGAIGVFKLNIEVNMKKFFKPDNPIRQSLEFMDEEMTGTMDLELLINADMKSPDVLNKMVTIQEFMDQHPSVTLSISIADVIKLMHRMINDDDPRFETIPETREKVNNLFTLYSMSGDPDDFSSLVDYDYEKGLTTSMMRAISTREIIQLVDEIEVYLDQPEYRELNITITGMLVVFRDLVALILKSSFISIFASILIICVIAAYFFKHWIWGLMAVIPLSSAVILNFGLMGIFGIDLNHVTALLSAIIIGVGVDFAIHYVNQFRIHLRRDGLAANISHETMRDVGYPVILDAASNMAFGSLMFSTFIPMIHMGGLMLFAMISTSVGTLTLLAATLELSKKYLARVEGVDSLAAIQKTEG